MGTGKYKYRNLSDMQGRRFSCLDTDEPQFQAGDVRWASQVAPNTVPPRSFLEKFTDDSETFFVDCRSGMFVRGPKYCMLKSVIENPSELMKSLVLSCEAKPDVFMLLAADVMKRHSSENAETWSMRP